MINKSTIDAVFDQMNIVEVVSDFVQLKKSGSSHKGLSPFSSERSPSFMVSESKGIFKDFSSGKGGNAITFIMEHERLDFPDAIRWLANKYGIEVSETKLSPMELSVEKEKEALQLINKLGAEWFQFFLSEELSKNTPAAQYFISRKISNDMIIKFMIGYTDESFNGITDKFYGHFDNNHLMKSSLVGLSQKGSFYDRFRSRIMFPIRSATGQYLGFGGRLAIEDKDAPKYLNTSENELYLKSKILYGLFESKQAISKEDHAIISEGYLDVISFHQIGIENIVSSSGTAFTIEQAKLLKRYCRKVTILFDSDPAGIRAVIRSIDLLLSEDITVNVCILPEGHDPDSISKSWPKEQIEDYIKKNSVDFILFKVDFYELNTLIDFSRAGDYILDIVSSISKCPNIIKKDLYLKECSRMTNISYDILKESLNKITIDIAEITNIQMFEAEKNEDKILLHRKQIEKRLMQYLLFYGYGTFVFKDVVLIDNGNNVFEKEITEEKLTLKEKFFNEILKDGFEFYTIEYQAILESFLSQKSASLTDFNSFKVTLPEYLKLTATELYNEEHVSFNNSYGKENTELYSNIAIRRDEQIANSINECLMSFKIYSIKSMIDDELKKPVIDMEIVSDYIMLIKEIKECLHLIS